MFTYEGISCFNQPAILENWANMKVICDYEHFFFLNIFFFPFSEGWHRWKPIMPLVKKCPGAQKHREWDIADGLELRVISDKYKNALLGLLGKKSKRDRERQYRFCTGCVDHLTEVKPELFEEKSTGDHSYGASTSATEVAPAKKRLEDHQKEASTQTETDTAALLVAALSERIWYQRLAPKYNKFVILWSWSIFA